MISPITVGLVAAAVAGVLLAGGHWLLAAALAVVVWIVRVYISTRIAKRVRALPRRIDPFALREPWRFFVRDALQARTRVTEALTRAVDGPLRDRLTELGNELTRGVEQCWEVAQRGQRLTDTRRMIDIDDLERTKAQLAPGDPRVASIEAQIDSHRRLREREEATQERLQTLDARLDEAVVRAAELATRSGAAGELESVGDSVTAVVHDLEALRQGLDDVGPPT